MIRSTLFPAAGAVSTTVLVAVFVCLFSLCASGLRAQEHRYHFHYHPVNPDTLHSTLPFRFSRGPERVHTTPAPLLGQHNRELLREIGLDDDDVDRLEAEGVIGSAPAR